MIIFDSHSHSNFSHDGHQEIKEQCKTSFEKGFKGIAITDHCEFSQRYWLPYCKEHIEKSISSAKELKKIYKDKMIISVGVEIGEALYHKDLANDLIKNNDLDFILCSCHSPEEKEDYALYNFTENILNVDKVLQEYFEMLEKTSSECDYDSLAHITYPIRYITGIHKIQIDLSKYSKVIDQILMNIINRNKAMEINTSGFRQPLGESMPNETIIRRYKELGGKLITLGSDAHRSEDMGKDFDKAIALMKKYGFTHYNYYIGRKPNEILI